MPLLEGSVDHLATIVGPFDNFNHILFASRHWLLDAVYGRELLKVRLRQLRPDMKVPVWRHRPELDPVLDAVIDDLNLREWQKPSGLKPRIAYLLTVLKMMNAVRCGEVLPAW